MKWVVAIAAALLLETGLLAAISSIRPPAIDATLENAKPEEGIPVVFRKSAPVSNPTPVKQQAPTKTGQASAAVKHVPTLTAVAPVSPVHAATPIQELASDEPAGAGAEVALSGEGSGTGAEVALSGEGTVGSGEHTADAGSGGFARAASVADLSSYGAQVIARIATTRRDVLQIQRMHLQGTATLLLSIGRDGQLVSLSLGRSAGHPLLDNEAQRMAKDAAPYPPLPAEYAQDTLALTVPVNFHAAQ
ncbi:MAG: energy transducer TonB [Myxococcaceae bacterium]